MRKLVIVSILLILSGIPAFAGLKFLLRPGFDFYRDVVGFGGTAGFRYYFYPQLPFMPIGLYVGAHGFLTYAGRPAYSLWETGPLADIGYTIMARGKTMTFTGALQIGAEYMTLSSTTTNAPDRWVFHGQISLDYESQIADPITLGISVGYRIYLTESVQFYPFLRFLFGWDIF